MLCDLADDQYQDEVLEDDEGVLQEVQDGVRLIQEEARVEAVTEILRRTLILQNKTIWEISYEALLWMERLGFSEKQNENEKYIYIFNGKYI